MLSFAADSTTSTKGHRMRDCSSSLGAVFYQASFSVPPQSPEESYTKRVEKKGEGHERPSTSGRRALVVDDVADVTEMLSVLLSHAGYSVVTASSAPQALSVANESHFDVVISDIGMPGMNGYQLARELRQLPGYEDVPLVAVTGYSMFDDRERSKSAGFNAHMTKPIDPRALLELIEQL